MKGPQRGRRDRDLIGRVVEVALGVRRLVVHCGRHRAGLDRLNTGDSLQSASSPQGVTSAALRRLIDVRRQTRRVTFTELIRSR